MKIRYKTRHGIAEWVDFEDSDSDTVTFAFEPYQNGVLLLGGKMLALKNGEATVSKTALADGSYIPRLETEHGVYTVEEFTKSGNSISLKKADEALIRQLLLRCYELENTVRLFEEKITGLENLCHGHQIFDFERKDK